MSQEEQADISKIFNTMTAKELAELFRNLELTLLEEICSLSARVIVNQVSMKRENERVTRLIRDLKTVLQEEQP